MYSVGSDGVRQVFVAAKSTAQRVSDVRMRECLWTRIGLDSDERGRRNVSVVVLNRKNARNESGNRDAADGVRAGVGVHANEPWSGSKVGDVRAGIGVHADESRSRGMIDDARDAVASRVIRIFGWSRKMRSSVVVLSVDEIAFNVLSTGALLAYSLNFGGTSESVEASLFLALRVYLRLLLG